MYDRGDSCAFSPRRGGDDGIRTHDPLLAGQVLSQLSYTPIFRSAFALLLKNSVSLRKRTFSKKRLFLSVPSLFRLETAIEN